MDIKSLRIIFMGTPTFACAPLQQLIDDGYNIVAVVSQPDKPVGRKKILTSTPVKQLATQYDIDVLQPVSIMQDYQQVLDYKPDCIITCAYGQKVPNVILDYPKYLCINLHGSLLPKYRGGAPIQRSIINGDTQTGMTLMQMVEKMDAGAMYSKRIVDIDIQDTYDSLCDKLMQASKEMIHEDLPKYFADELVGQPQDESLRSLAFTIKKETEYVSFESEEVTELYNHMRGLISTPAPYAFLNEKKVKFYKVGLEVCNHNDVIGSFKKEKDHFKIAAKGGYIHVFICQIEGKNKVDGASFYNGLANYKEQLLFK